MSHSLLRSTENPEDDSWDHDLSTRRHLKARRRCLCSLSISLFAASVLFSARFWAPGVTPWKQNGLSHPKFTSFSTGSIGDGNKDVKYCGYSPSEGTASDATTRGCVYDIISGSWVHPECHDAELEAEFLAHQPPWKWWADEQRTQEVSVDELRATGGLNPTGYFVTPEYHDYHCAYTWRKLHRAIEGSGLIDEHIGGMRHTNHCSSTMYRDRTDERDVAHFDLIFSGCMQL